MFKIMLALLLMTSSAFANQWRNGTGENTILGTSNAALIGYNSYNSIVQPLDNLLATYCNEYLQYTSSSTLTVSSGSCVVSNSGATVRLFLLDTASSTLTSSNLDTGSLTASTKYYVYSTAATTSSTSSTYYISASNTAPSGQNYYYQIGNFTTDSSTNITGIVNNNWNSYVVGPIAYANKSSNVVYQALTDGLVSVYGACSSANSYEILTGTTSSPNVAIANCNTSSSTTIVNGTISALIRKGDYYEGIQTAGSSGIAVSFTQLGK